MPVDHSESNSLPPMWGQEGATALQQIQLRRSREFLKGDLKNASCELWGSLAIHRARAMQEASRIICLASQTLEQSGDVVVREFLL